MNSITDIPYISRSRRRSRFIRISPNPVLCFLACLEGFFDLPETFLLRDFEHYVTLIALVVFDLVSHFFFPHTMDAAAITASSKNKKKNEALNKISSLRPNLAC